MELQEPYTTQSIPSNVVRTLIENINFNIKLLNKFDKFLSDRDSTYIKGSVKLIKADKDVIFYQADYKDPNSIVRKQLTYSYSIPTYTFLNITRD